MPYIELDKRRKFNAKWAADKRRRHRERLWSRKDLPCTDCGVKYSPWMMQFDHVRGIKVSSLSNLASNGTLTKLLEEIEKCEVVCANCHADRTYKRGLSQGTVPPLQGV